MSSARAQGHECTSPHPGCQRGSVGIEGASGTSSLDASWGAGLLSVGMRARVHVADLVSASRARARVDEPRRKSRTSLGAGQQTGAGGVMTHLASELLNFCLTKWQASAGAPPCSDPRRGSLRPPPDQDCFASAQLLPQWS